MMTCRLASKTSSQGVVGPCWPTSSMILPPSTTSPRGPPSASIARGSRIQVFIDPALLDRPLVVEPAAGLRCEKQFRQRGIERGRLFAGDVVAGAGNYQQSRGRRCAFQKKAAFKTWLVFIPNDHKQGRGEVFQVGLHFPKRRALELYAEHGVRMTQRRMLAEHVREL